MFENLKSYLIASFNFYSAKSKLSLNNPASIVYNMVSSFCALAIEILGGTEVGFRRLNIDTATGTDLEALGDNYNLERNQGTPSVGSVYLWQYNPVGYTIIPVGTQVYSDESVTFITTQTCVIPGDSAKYPYYTEDHPEFLDLDASPSHPSNTAQRYYALVLKEGVEYDPDIAANEQFEASKNIPIQSIEIGRHYNLDALKVTKTDANVGGTSPAGDEESGVENPLPLSGGSDPESDEEYRTRIKRHLGGTGTSTITYLENAALLPGIDDARIIEPDDKKAKVLPPPGAIYLVVASARATYTPRWASEEEEVALPVSFPSSLKQTIRNEAEDLRSAGVGVIVKEAQVVGVNFNGPTGSGSDLIIYVEKGTSLLNYTAIVENRLNSLLESYKIGQDVYKSDIINAIKQIDAVVDLSPFDLVAERWLNNAVSISLGSVEGEAIGRDGLVINAEEIARPPLAYRFHLEFHYQDR